MLKPLTSLLAALPLCAAAQQLKPNIIVLVADDLGYGDLSCYGATRVSTPTVDSLAANGVRMTNMHACASTSTPSRYALLTGEYPFRRTGTDVAAGNAGMIIKPGQTTVADLMHRAGYATAAIGKWHLGLGSRTAAQDWNGTIDLTPRDLGFDYHYIMAATADRVPCVYIENGRVANYDASAPISVSYQHNFEGEPTGRNNPELLTKLRPSHGHDMSIVNGISRIGYMKGGGRALWRDESIADSIVSHAIGFIDSHRATPFFMYLCTNDVHVPRMPHERFRGKSVMGLRGEAIMQFDWTVRQITDALRQRGIDRNTLIIITSDNGPVLDDGYQDRAIELCGTHKPSGPLPQRQIQCLRGWFGCTLHRLLARGGGPRHDKRRPWLAHRHSSLISLTVRCRTPTRRGTRQPEPHHHLVGPRHPSARLCHKHGQQPQSDIAHAALQIHLTFRRRSHDYLGAKN